MPFNYNPLTNPSANIIALLREQNEAGTEYGKFAGAEPLEVLFAKAIFNANANGGGGGGSWNSLTGKPDGLMALVDKLEPDGSINDANLPGTATAENLSAETAQLKNITINRTLLNDDESSGIKIGGTNAGAEIAQWEAVYIDTSDGELKLASASAAATAPAVGLAVTSGTDGNPLVFIQNGYVRNDAWNWSAGLIYLSTTGGGLTQTAPSTSGQIVQPVGRMVTADIAYFNFNQPYFTVA